MKVIVIILVLFIVMVGTVEAGNNHDKKKHREYRHEKVCAPSVTPTVISATPALSEVPTPSTEPTPTAGVSATPTPEVRVETKVEVKEVVKYVIPESAPKTGRG